VWDSIYLSKSGPGFHLTVYVPLNALLGIHKLMMRESKLKRNRKRKYTDIINVKASLSKCVIKDWSMDGVKFRIGIFPPHYLPLNNLSLCNYMMGNDIFISKGVIFVFLVWK
jgi:hypothetical protein